MKISDIRNKAKALGIMPENMSKPELIRAIQMKEGYSPCYGNPGGRCMYVECCFRQDCLTPQAVSTNNADGYLRECQDIMQRINSR